MNKFWDWLEDKPQVAATIILKNNRALILRRGMTTGWMPGKWNLPGGNVDPNEAIQAAAIRECEEEAGITPIRLTFLSKINDPHYTINIFRGETEQEPRLDHENDAFAWVNFEELNHYDFVPYVQIEIGKVLRSQTTS
jgi:8-oxo-dGTP diphosphatase